MKMEFPTEENGISQGETEKFIGTLISFFRSLISFFRTFIFRLRGEFSFLRKVLGNSS